MNKSISLSRQYVAVCSNRKFEGYHFIKFELPESMPNNSEVASWYFLNVIDPIAVSIDGCFSFEDFSNLQEGFPWVEKKETSENLEV